MQQPLSGSRFRSFIFPWGLILVGALLRILYVWQFSANTPFFDAPVIDAKMYDQMARQIAGGAWIGTVIYYQSPFYAYMLGLLYTVTGVSYLAAYLFQILLGLATLLLIYRLGIRVFNRPVAATAACMALLYGPFMFYETKLLMTTLAVFLNLLTLLWLLKTRESPSRLKWFTAGLFIGAAVLVRGNMLFFLPFLLVWLYIMEGKKWRNCLATAGIVMAGVLLTIAPVTIRNYLVGKDFVPIAANTGITFYMGTSPEASGTYTRIDGLSGVIQNQEEEERQLAEEALGRILKPSEVTAYWYRKGFTYIRSHPLRYAQLLLKKTLLFFSTLELANNYSFYLERSLVPVLWIPFLPFGILSSLGIVGLVLAARKNRSTLLLAFYVTAYLISLLLFFVISRYRLPVVPVLILFASYTLNWMVTTARRRKIHKLLIPSAAVCLLLIVNAYPHKEKEGMLGGAYNALGNVYADKKMFPSALQSYQRAVALSPNTAPIYNNMGNVYFSLNQMDQAEQAYAKAIEQDSTHYRAYFNVAMVWKTRGEYERVIDSLQRLLRFQPANMKAHYELGNAYRLLGRTREAIESYRRAIELQPDYAEAHNNLGIMYMQTGREEEALREWKQAAEIAPGSEAARSAGENIRALNELKRTTDQEHEEERK